MNHEELIIWALALILDNQEKIMATLADAVAADTQLQADVQAIETALTNVEAQLAALQASGLTPAQQAQVDQITTDLGAMHTSITTALTPPAPPAPSA